MQDLSKTGSYTETLKYQSGKTLWDWLELAGTLAVPILIVVIGYQLEQREKKRIEKQAELETKRAEEQAELETKRAEDNLSEEAIQAYLDNIAKLLLDKELRKELFPNRSKVILGVSIEDKEDKDNPVRDVARTQTITILRRLESDKKRQDRIIHFLRDAELYEFIFENANLSRANLQEVNLYKINLQGANLEFADLQQAYLWVANLQKANLSRANLTPKQIKVACFWNKAIYKGEWHWKEETKTWVPKNEQSEQDNTKFIEELKKDKSSDPQKPVDCSRWEK